VQYKNAVTPFIEQITLVDAIKRRNLDYVFFTFPAIVIIEELVFRCFLLAYLDIVFGFWDAIFVQAAIFSLYHFIQVLKKKPKITVFLYVIIAYPVGVLCGLAIQIGFFIAVIAHFGAVLVIAYIFSRIK